MWARNGVSGDYILPSTSGQVVDGIATSRPLDLVNGVRIDLVPWLVPILPPFVERSFACCRVVAAFSGHRTFR